MHKCAIIVRLRNNAAIAELIDNSGMPILSAKTAGSTFLIWNIIDIESCFASAQRFFYCK
jgi:hypothetical protein